ncbi:MAG: hypothetical protein ACOYOK_05020 [Pseudobdellovibrionaceae bacterium]
MKKISILFLLCLSACVRIKDIPSADADSVKPPSSPKSIDFVQNFDLEEVSLNESVYLFQGEFISPENFNQLSETEKSIQQKSVLNIKNLFLGPNAVVYFLNQDVELHIQNMISDNAQWTTYQEGQTAPQGVNGRHGGNLIMNIDNAKGVLKMVLRGENGGLAPAGPMPTADMTGTPGKNGDPSEAVVKQCAGRNCISEWICTKHPTDGDPGGQGKPGNTGFPGRNGGHSGTAMIKVQSGADFLVQALIQPGKFSQGGRGPGGPGGQGGKPGAQSNMFACHEKVPKGGDDGPEGNLGAEGPPGIDGQKQNIIIEQNGQRIIY